MQYYDEEKKEASKSTSQPAAPAQKAASSVAPPSQQSVWTQSMGNHPPENLQTKLTVNQPGDPYEQEADRVADQVVMRKHKATPAILGEEEQKLMRKHTGTPAILGEEEEEQRLMRKQRSSGAQGEGAPPIVSQALSSSGQPLDAGTQASMEAHFGQDFSNVRIHTDGQAANSAQAINARAYTVWQDVVFGEGQYAPGTSEGERLLAHELTHVVQQRGTEKSEKSSIVLQKAPHMLQGSFFGDVWGGIKSVGKAIGKAATEVGHAIGVGAQWVGERLRDVGDWAFNLVRDLPMRLVRFGQTIIQGLVGIATFISDAISALRSGGIKGFASWLWERAKSGGAWILTLLDRIFDLVGGPEILEFLLHLMEHTSPLTAQQKEAAQSVLGQNAIRWNQVRVAEGGILSIIFHFNQARAFTTFHTINLPPNIDLPTVVHELTHVYQYEHVGSIYIGGAIHAQITLGEKAYDYEDLKTTHKHYRDFNREQQAQIAEDYYILKKAAKPDKELIKAYEPFITELCAGDL